VKGDLHNIKVRVTSIEESMGAMNRRLDAMDGRLECIESQSNSGMLPDGITKMNTFLAI
jgi:hypothetical protein